MRPPAPLAVAAVAVSLCLAAACHRDAPRPDPGASTTIASGSPTPTSTPSIAAPEVAVGKPPPDFNVKDHKGAELKLSALKGKPVVLYFYPKDETPGCTAEAKDLRDSWKDLEKTGAIVIGVSTDSVASHGAFAKHHDLPFHLVSDESGALAKSFGVPSRMGFLARQTFVIGADGHVRKIYRNVDVSKHARDILSDLQP